MPLQGVNKAWHWRLPQGFPKASLRIPYVYPKATVRLPQGSRKRREHDLPRKLRRDCAKVWHIMYQGIAHVKREGGAGQG
jgi:hypothetical protein